MKRCPQCNRIYVNEWFESCPYDKSVIEEIISLSEACTAKYIFLDVVGFTHNRSIEAQSDIVSILNDIVRYSLLENNIANENVIFIPTGDGICITLLNTESPFDIQLLIALMIIKEIQTYNDYTKDETRKFQVRIGLNSHLDNLITDINGQRNIAGAGISIASRIMGLADGNQILVAQSVYETLRYRERYSNSFKALHGEIKHGIRIPVYQFTEESHIGLNTDIPKALEPSVYIEPKLTKFAAYYLAHAIKNRPFFLQHKDGTSEWPSQALLYFLATDSVKQAEASEIDSIHYSTYKAGVATLEEQYKYYASLRPEILYTIEELLLSKYLDDYTNCFEGVVEYRFVNSKGIEKLKKEWPSIWEEFNLNEVSETRRT